eukprot:scaffold2804_cov371-Prasinococcus_capsulatus_cf.AAC.8
MRCSRQYPRRALALRVQAVELGRPHEGLRSGLELFPRKLHAPQPVEGQRAPQLLLSRESRC